MLAGRIGRARFALYVLLAVAAFATPVVLTFAYLRELGVWFAPFGFNATSAQNTLIIGVGVVTVLALTWAGVMRLRDAGDTPALSVIGLPAAFVVGVLDSPLFLQSYVPLSRGVTDIVLLFTVGIAAYVVVVGLFVPSRPQRSGF